MQEHRAERARRVVREHEPARIMLCTKGRRPFIADAWLRDGGFVTAVGRFWSPSGDGPRVWVSIPTNLVLEIRALPERATGAAS